MNQQQQQQSTVAAAIAPDRRFNRRVRLSFAVSCGLNLFALVLLLVSLQQEGWFYASDVTSSWTLGLNKGCSNSLCTQLKYQDISRSICTTNGKDFNARMDAVKWLLYISIACGFISIALYAHGSIKGPAQLTPATAVNVMAFVLEFISLVIFVHTTNAWLYCGDNFSTFKARFCSASATPTTCNSSSHFGYGAPFVMAACATVLFFVASLWSLVSLIVSKSREKVMNKILQSRGYSNAPVDFQAPSGFEFDSDSGLFYSWAMQLYLDPVSCHYYDPHSALWYNADTQSWYSLSG